MREIAAAFWRMSGISEVVKRLKDRPVTYEANELNEDVTQLEKYLADLERRGDHLSGEKWLLIVDEATKVPNFVSREDFIKDPDGYATDGSIVLRQLGETKFYFSHVYDEEKLWIYTPEGMVDFDVPFTEASQPWESILLSIAELGEPMGPWVSSMQWILDHRKNPKTWIATYRTIINSPWLLNKIDWLNGILDHITSVNNGYENLDMVQKQVTELQFVVAPRVEKDMKQLHVAGLIGRDHILKRIEFSGADFHKNARCVLFLYFHSPGDGRRIVYKPSNLAVDALLVGTENSLAHLIDPKGIEIPQYKIIPMSDDLGDYGYMEFVTSADPTSQDDVKALARSIGATAAFSYLVGIHDLHHENVLLRQNRVQLIDVESTYGIFDPAYGFEQQGLDLGIRQFSFATFRTYFFPHLGRKEYESFLEREATVAFINHLVKVVWISEDFEGNWNHIIAKLGKTRSRFIPIGTSMFYSLVPTALRKTFPEWKTFVRRGRFRSTADEDFDKQILVAEETYNALHRGEIPFYWNDLGSTDILDEAGNKLDLEHLLPSYMIRKPIVKEIAERLTELRGDNGVMESDGFRLFTEQIRPLLLHAPYE